LVIVGNDPHLSGTAQWPHGTDQTWKEVFAGDSPLFALFKSTRVFHFDVRNNLRFDHQTVAARAFMGTHGLELVVPFRSQSKTVLGLMVLGARCDGRRLTKSDVELLEILAANIVSRIERIAAIQNVKLRQSNEAKDQFLASMNHEIRNPLNGINGIVRMMKAQPSDARSTYLLTALASCSDQLGSTMDEVLDFTQIESGTVTLVASDVDLVQLVRTTCASHDLSGTHLIPTDLPNGEVLVHCDSGKVRQILSNYCVNALKYGVPIGAQIALSVDYVPDVARITLSVISTGPTLGEAEQASLFTTLTRGRRARETNAHGAGLGLAVCKRLANAMGGSVGVESIQGKTTFWFKAEFPSVSTVSAPDEVAVPAFAGCRALAIEDESYNRLVLGNYLSKLQITPVWAENGAAALAIAHHQDIDVVLMDWLLPDMDGAELLQKMRDTRTQLPPVIVLTAYSTAAKRAACLTAGAVAFISKPVDLEKLTAALKQCTFRKRSLISPSEESSTATVDLSPLIALGTGTSVIDSFHQEVLTGSSRLFELWRKEPQTAALLAHRLKAQMLLVRANESAGLLELLEQALTECWATDDISRLVATAELELNRIIAAIRLQAGLS
jgi:signal transduction histidine kinase/CheY-like chemotaxis protein